MAKLKKIISLIKTYGFIKTFKIIVLKLSGCRFVQKKKAVSIIKKSMNPQKLNREKNNHFDKEPLISILTPLYNTDVDMLKCVIESVINQTYRNVELCLCDGSDDSHGIVGEICNSYARKDARIKYLKLSENGGIAANTNACAGMAEGEYLALLDHDDILHPSAVYRVVKAINETGADFLYTDEVTFAGKITNVLSTNLKPDYSPDTLRANNYICHFTVFSKELFNSVGGFKSQYDGSQDHDLVLRLTDAAAKIFHIPEILYFWRAHEGSVVENISAKEYAVSAGRNAVKDFLTDKGIEAEVSSTDVYPTIYRIKYMINDTPLISVIILNKNHKEDLSRCLDSIKKSSYSDIEIIIVENNSTEESIFEYYKTLTEENIKIITVNEPFNYSAFNNIAAGKAKGEYLLFLNNDTEVINPQWIEEMLMFAARKDVGAVGARLLYPDNTLQHCYVITGIGEDKVAVHAGVGLPKDDYGYLDRIGFNQNVNAVTGACLMVRSGIFKEIGGFDEKLPVAYNDVDLCLKLREKGYLNVYTPFAVLYHYESASRGRDNDKGNRKRLLSEAEYMKKKWGVFLKDPYYNPNFSDEKAYILR